MSHGTTRRTFLLTGLAVIAAAGCGGTSDNEPEASETEPPSDNEPDASGPEPAAGSGIRLVAAQAGADIQNDPPPDLVVLDVRTPEEFAEGHLDGAVMIDFYEDDFADRIADLDPEVPYLLYCRSGNRSGQTTTLMGQLGFTDVADIDGGIVAWTAAGLPTVTP